MAKPPPPLKISDFISSFTCKSDQSWYMSLLAYPEVFQGSVDLGNGVTSSMVVDKLLIPNAGPEVGLEFVRTLVGIDGDLSEEWKRRGLEVGVRVGISGQILGAVFPDGVNYERKLLIEEEFSEEVWKIRNEARFVEDENVGKEELSSKISRLLMQDPLNLIQQLTRLSLRTGLFKLLKSTLPAFGLKPKFDSNLTIGEEALLLNLRELDYEDKMYDSINLKKLVDEGLYDFSSIDKIFKVLIKNSFSICDLRMAEKLIVNYCGLIELLIGTIKKVDVDVVVDYLDFIVGFTRIGWRGSSCQIMIKVRDSCLKLIEKMGHKGVVVKYDDSWGWKEVCLGYVRLASIRDEVEGLELLDIKVDQVEKMLLDFLSNSGYVEVNSVYELYSKVLLKYMNKNISNDFIDILIRRGVDTGLDAEILLKFYACHLGNMKLNCDGFKTDVNYQLKVIETLCYIIIGKVKLMVDENNYDDDDCEIIIKKKKKKNGLLTTHLIESKVPVVEVLQEILEFSEWAINDDGDFYKDAVRVLKLVPRGIRGFGRVTAWQAYMSRIIRGFGGSDNGHEDGDGDGPEVENCGGYGEDDEDDYYDEEYLDREAWEDLIQREVDVDYSGPDSDGSYYDELGHVYD